MGVTLPHPILVSRTFLSGTLPRQSTLYISGVHGRSFSSAVPSTDICHKVESTKCTDDLHYNRTFVESADQKKSDVTFLQSIVNTKCSPDIEKYLCFSRLPPCVPNDKAAYVPCRYLCEKVHKECEGEFKKKGMVLPPCDSIFPVGSNPSGLCPLKRWPAPWPQRSPSTTPG